MGNDVVDLDDPDNRDAHERERFVARVCTPAERARLAAAADPGTLLWALFAAKEAAYKVAAKLGPAPGFAHRRFEVAADLETVADTTTGRAMRLEVEIDRARGFVHAVATTGGVAHPRGVRTIAAGADASPVARRALCEAVARATGEAAGALAVHRAPAPGSWDGFGPPHLERDGRPAPGVDVSLSHDGRFVAYAATGCRAAAPR